MKAGSDRAEREGLIARIRLLRRTAAAAPDRDSRSAPRDHEGDRIAALESRLSHLEQLVEGLQDSVYRDAQRQRSRLDELESRTQPGAMSAALSRDARERGL